jgi:hypothetical protein
MLNIACSLMMNLKNVGGFGMGVYFKLIPLQKYLTLGHFTHHTPVMKAILVPCRYKCVFLLCSLQPVIIFTKWFIYLAATATHTHGAWIAQSV